MATSQHLAQFYEQEEFLLKTASDFLATGLASKSTCIVIATREHRDGITERLQQNGRDVVAASGQGTYIELDAATTLSHLLADGAAYPERFAHIIDPLLKHIPPQERRIHIFGEMTALLWMQGQREAALVQEELLNTLLDSFSFSTLLCAYPLQSFTGDIDRRQFAHLCSQHVQVTIPGESYTLLTNPRVRLQTVTLLQQKAMALQEEITKNSAYAHQVQDLLHLLNTLQATNEQLEQASTTFHHFIAKMGHEFRTGLTTIQGFSELLSTQEWGTEEVKEYAGYIMTDSQRLTRLIEEVLDLERLKSGKVDLRWEWVDMNALLQQLATQTQQTTSKHTLICHLDETLLPVPGDPDKFTQVLSNLLSNAVKYSPHGGEIVLRSQGTQEMVQISIQDQGIGIAARVQDKIFVPYNRVESEKTRYIQGLGLGLSVVREIIGLYGGTIWVESAPEHGSIFHFTLPLTRKHSDASPEEEMETFS